MRVVRFHAITPGAILSAAIRHVREQRKHGEITPSAAFDVIQILERAQNKLYADRLKQDWENWQKELQKKLQKWGN